MADPLAEGYGLCHLAPPVVVQWPFAISPNAAELWRGATFAPVKAAGPGCLSHTALQPPPQPPLPLPVPVRVMGLGNPVPLPAPTPVLPAPKA